MGQHPPEGTTFDEDSVQTWGHLGTGKDRTKEERPYRVCPNCSRHKFRALRTLKGGIIFGNGFYHEYTERCKNCKYKGKSWNDKE